MRLPGTQNWSDETIEAALSFADNLRVSTVSVIIAIIERNLPGGPINRNAWEPTDLVYKLGDAAGLAFATGRVTEGLQFAATASRIGGAPPQKTLMQTLFSATLGTIAGTLSVTLFEDEVTINAAEPRGFVSIDLSDHSITERQRLAELIIPAAFASPSFLDEIPGLAVDFDPEYRVPTIDWFARLSPMVRFARDFKRTEQMDQSLLMGSLLDYEGYIETLRDDVDAWPEMVFRGSLIDWPLLATLVGMNRWVDTEPDADLVVGPATRFLHDLAREIARSTAPTLEGGALA